MLEALDELLITFYKVTGNPVWDYFLGTFLLALLVVVVGHGTVLLVLHINGKHLEKLDDRLGQLNRLTDTALKMGDRRNYRLLNKEAGDAYGQVFFNRFGLSAASLWPAFLALAWMQERFIGIHIPIPYLGVTANYFLVFLGSYVLAKIVFNRIRRRWNRLSRPHRHPTQAIPTS